MVSGNAVKRLDSIYVNIFSYEELPVKVSLTVIEKYLSIIPAE